MKERYWQAKHRSEKSKIIDEVVSVLGYHRKYAIAVLRDRKPRTTNKIVRTRTSKYAPAKPVIYTVWEALDYPCAERLHPVLVQTALLLEKHGEVTLEPRVRILLESISLSTLARMLLKSRPTKIQRMSPPRQRTRLQREVPMEKYDSGEMRPGALEADLVEHNGGSSLGHYAYTLTVVDVATGYSRRRAVLGRGQLGVHRELKKILMSWPYPIWCIHTDNGNEFLNDHLIRYCKANNLKYTRSRPYRKNDNPHAEQKNFQHVRCLVGYERFDTEEQVAWLNTLYAVYDTYINLFQPTRKLTAKERHGSNVRKYYDTAKTPVQRATLLGVVTAETQKKLHKLYEVLNPLSLHRQIQSLVAQSMGTEPAPVLHASVDDVANT